MIYIYLPGFSPKNELEMDANVAEFTKAGLEFIKHRYKHWDDSTLTWENWDREGELQAILSEIEVSGEVEVGIVGKSIGSYLATQLLTKLQLKGLVLMGIPVNALKPEEIDDYRRLATLNIPITVIQNTQDPYGGEEEIRQLLEGINYKMVVKEAADHNYQYSQDILNALHF